MNKKKIYSEKLYAGMVLNDLEKHFVHLYSKGFRFKGMRGCL